MSCAFAGCPELHRYADGFCHNHRAEASAALAIAALHGGDALTISRRLGFAGMEALAPFLWENTRLQTLVLRRVKLGANGAAVLADALKANATITMLDVSENELKESGAKAMAAMLAR